MLLNKCFACNTEKLLKARDDVKRPKKKSIVWFP